MTLINAEIVKPTASRNKQEVTDPGPLSGRTNIPLGVAGFLKHELLCASLLPQARGIFYRMRGVPAATSNNKTGIYLLTETRHLKGQAFSSTKNTLPSGAFLSISNSEQQKQEQEGGICSLNA